MKECVIMVATVYEPPLNTSVKLVRPARKPLSLVSATKRITGNTTIYVTCVMARPGITASETIWRITLDTLELLDVWWKEAETLLLSNIQLSRKIAMVKGKNGGHVIN